MSVRYRYDAWGNERVVDGSGSGNTYTYTSRRKDADLGLLYYRARYYDPSIGRFISQDPFSGGPDDARISYKNDFYEQLYGEFQLNLNFLSPHAFNRYVYVSNNPLKYTDPLGLIAETGVSPGIGGIGGIKGQSADFKNSKQVTASHTEGKKEKRERLHIHYTDDQGLLNIPGQGFDADCSRTGNFFFAREVYNQKKAEYQMQIAKGKGKNILLVDTSDLNLTIPRPVLHLKTGLPTGSLEQIYSGSIPLVTRSGTPRIIYAGRNNLFNRTIIRFLMLRGK